MCNCACAFKLVLTWEEYEGLLWDWRPRWQPAGSVPVRTNPLLPEKLPDLHYSGKERQGQERKTVRSMERWADSCIALFWHWWYPLVAHLLLSRGELEWNLKQSDPQRIPAKSQKCTTLHSPPTPQQPKTNARQQTRISAHKAGVVWFDKEELREYTEWVKI